MENFSGLKKENKTAFLYSITMQFYSPFYYFGYYLLIRKGVLFCHIIVKLVLINLMIWDPPMIKQVDQKNLGQQKNT